jgi:mpaB/rubber oxygenase-like protein
MWPADRTAFDQYWNAALAEVRIDPPVRDYLDRLVALDYLPRPLSAQMQLSWTQRDEQVFAALLGLVAVVNRLLPGPVSRFPFNACMQDLRIRRLVKAVHLRAYVSNAVLTAAAIAPGWAWRTIPRSRRARLRTADARVLACLVADGQPRGGPVQASVAATLVTLWIACGGGDAL